MTKQQQAKVERIRASLLNGGGLPREVKEEKLTDHGAFAELVLEVGIVGDEGKMSEIFCRDRIQIFLGPRGGVKAGYSNGHGRPPLYLSGVGTVDGSGKVKR